MDNNQKQRELDSDVITIDVLRLAKALLRKAWLIAMVALLCGSAAYCWTRVFVEPMYYTSFSLYINTKSDDTDRITSSDINTSRSLVTTYSALLESQPLLEKAAEAAGLDTIGSVSTSTEDDTEIIQVYVMMNDPEDTYAFAQGMMQVAPDYIAGIVEGSSMRFITEPDIPLVMNGSVYLTNAVKGLLVGGVLVGGIVVLLELLDSRAKSERELEERYGMAVLGVIPNMEEAQKRFPADQEIRKGK